MFERALFPGTVYLTRDAGPSSGAGSIVALCRPDRAPTIDPARVVPPAHAAPVYLRRRHSSVDRRASLEQRIVGPITCRTRSSLARQLATLAVPRPAHETLRRGTRFALVRPPLRGACAGHASLSPDSARCPFPGRVRFRTALNPAAY